MMSAGQDIFTNKKRGYHFLYTNTMVVHADDCLTEMLCFIMNLKNDVTLLSHRKVLWGVVIRVILSSHPGHSWRECFHWKVDWHPGQSTGFISTCHVRCSPHLTVLLFSHVYHVLLGLHDFMILVLRQSRLFFCGITCDRQLLFFMGNCGKAL